MRLLHCLGDVDITWIDARFLHCRVQKFFGGANKWMTAPILTISRLFADEHNPRAILTLAKNGCVASLYRSQLRQALVARAESEMFVSLADSMPRTVPALRLGCPSRCRP